MSDPNQDAIIKEKDERFRKVVQQRNILRAAIHEVLDCDCYILAPGEVPRRLCRMCDAHRGVLQTALNKAEAYP